MGDWMKMGRVSTDSNFQSLDVLNAKERKNKEVVAL